MSSIRFEGRASRAPNVCVIVLNWNNWRDTEVCLQSIRESNYPNSSIIVLDNGSRDDSWRDLQEWILKEKLDHECQDLPLSGGSSEKSNTPSETSVQFDTSTKSLCGRWLILRSAENLGFAGGVNACIVKAFDLAAIYVMLLNNDARLPPNAISRLVEIEESTGAGAVGATILNGLGSEVLFGGAQWPATMFWGGKSLLSSRPNLPDVLPSDDVNGAACMFRASLLERRVKEEGFALDPDFFMYCEETDLCRYVIESGHQCFLACNVRVPHGLARSSGGVGNPRSYYYLSRNKVRLAKRWLSGLWRVAFTVYYIPSRIVLVLIKLFSGRFAVAAAINEGVIDGYLRRTGKWRKHDRNSVEFDS